MIWPAEVGQHAERAVACALQLVHALDQHTARCPPALFLYYFYYYYLYYYYLYYYYYYYYYYY